LQRFEEENTHMDSDNEPKGFTLINLTMKHLNQFAIEYANTSNALQGKNFLNLLAQWSCEELDEKLKQRVEFSQRTTAKLMQICNHLGIRNSKLNAQLQDKQKRWFCTILIIYLSIFNLSILSKFCKPITGGIEKRG